MMFQINNKKSPSKLVFDRVEVVTLKYQNHLFISFCRLRRESYWLFHVLDVAQAPVIRTAILFFYFTECFLVHDLNKCTHLTAFATAWKLTILSNIYQNVHLGKTLGLTSVLVYARETLIWNDLINSVLFLPTQSVLSGSLQQGIGREMNTGRKVWSSYHYCKLFIPKRHHSLFVFFFYLGLPWAAINKYPHHWYMYFKTKWQKRFVLTMTIFDNITPV